VYRLATESESKFRLLFQDNPQPMWVLDRDTLEFLDVNDAAVHRYGYSREEFLSMRLDDMRAASDNDAFRDLVERSVSDGHSLGQLRHKLKDGDIIDVEIAVHPVPYSGRNAALAVIIDITERKQLEEQLRQAQKMEAIGMLAGGIAHDFNNLLTIISGYGQLLLTAMSPEDSNRAAVDQIMKASDRAAALTRQLLAFSRRQVLQLKVIDLNALVAGMVNMLRRLIGEDVEFSTRLVPKLGCVNADPGQLEQVIMNLVVNARDAMPHGGNLTIETSNVDLDRHYSGIHIALEPGPYVLLAVTDDGSGMDAETRSHLFEPFFTTKGQGKGTGLGLSTVFGIVKQSGGNLEVHSEPGRGTSVKVYLPRIAQCTPDQAADAAQAHAGGGSETILVVEDDDSVRRLVQETLSRDGYELLAAADGMAAIRTMEKHNGPIDLLLTDVVMPGMNGRELAGAAERLRPEIKVLFMSGYTDSATGNTADRDGGFLQKPFTPAVLSRKVRESLGADQ
jgi:PAS domain S-box-containing protein